MPREHPYIRGTTNAEKFASIEATLRSLTRQVVKRATVYIPPVPLFMHSDGATSGGLIGSFLLPFSGTVKEVFIRAEALQGGAVAIGITIHGNSYESTSYLRVTKRTELIKIDMDVEAGALLELKVDEGTLGEVFIATALYPKIEDHIAKQYLLSEMVEEEEENAV